MSSYKIATYNGTLNDKYVYSIYIHIYVYICIHLCIYMYMCNYRLYRQVVKDNGMI